MIKVVNKKTYKGAGVYIGRPTPLGNPFPVSNGRERCIEQYEQWLDEQLMTNPLVRTMFDALVVYYRHTGSLTLTCWCAPLACHGDVIARKIKEICNETED